MQSPQSSPLEVWQGISSGPSFREGVLEAMAHGGASRAALGIVGNLLLGEKESKESVHALDALTEGRHWQDTAVMTPGFVGLPVGLAASLGKSRSLHLLLEKGAATHWPETVPLLVEGETPQRGVSVLVEATLGALLLSSLHGSHLRCLEILANAGLDPTEPDLVTGRTAPEEFLVQVSGMGPDAWADYHHTPIHRPWEAVWERWLKSSPDLARKVLELEDFDWRGRWVDLSPEEARWVTLRDANLLPCLLAHARASLAMERGKALEERWHEVSAGRRHGSRL